MCGRFTLTEEADAIADAFAADIGPIRDIHEPRYNIAPTDEAPVVIAAQGGRRAGPMRWGLLPHWAEDMRVGARMINARAETVATRPAFRESFRARRCLVPSDGFYEWESRATGKQPYWIHRPRTPLFAMAGIWSLWTPPHVGRLATFSILTRPAPRPLRWLHDRVPVILPAASWDDWLARGTTATVLGDMLRNAVPPELRWHPVSRAVNRAGHDEPDCTDRVELAD